MSQKTRLLFKFYRSYFDVACELSDKDRLAFYDAIMQKEFLGIEPNLKGSARFAYISQKHSIDAQVKGWEDYFKTQIADTHATIPPTIPPTIQEEEKEKEEEEEEETIKKTNTVFSFDEFWETYNKKTGRVDCERIYARLKDKDYAKIKETLPIYLERLKEKDKQYQKNPKTYLNGRYWEDEIYQEEAKTTEPTKPALPYEGFNPLSIDLSKLKPLR